MEDSLGHLHPSLVHFPIVLFALGLFCDLLNGIGKRAALGAAHWLIIGGAVMCIPTLITGWISSESFPPDNPLIPTHLLLGFVMSGVGFLHAIFRGLALHKEWQFHPVVYVSCSLITLILVAATADYGGRITHGMSVFGLF